MQFPQSSNTSNSHKMVCSHHFIPFSVFGVSKSINCLFVRAQTQFILFDTYIIISCIVKNFQSSLNEIIDRMLIIVTVHTMCDQQRLYKSLSYIISKNLPTSIGESLKKCYIMNGIICM